MMRSLSLARVLNQYVQVSMWLCPGGEHWIEYIARYNISADIYSDPGVMHQKGVVVDGYAFTQTELAEWYQQAQRMVFIDDIGIAPEFADIVIAPGGDVRTIASPVGQVVLEGLHYALLAQEYIPPGVPEVAESVTEILVSFGLRDTKNYVAKVLDGLRDAAFTGRVTVAIGSNAPYLKSIQDKVGNYPFQLRIVRDAVGLYGLLKHCDMAIGAGGVTLLERMVIGIPSITLVVAENQMGQVKLSEEAGATLVVSRFSDLPLVINGLIASWEKRLDMSLSGMRVVDGRGIERIVRCLIEMEC
jgi:spore coat polysaccharide biosynthesis predicted glycosyltransferase SpsG